MCVDVHTGVPFSHMYLSTVSMWPHVTFFAAVCAVLCGMKRCTPVFGEGTFDPPDVAICSTWSHEPTDGLCSASTTSRRQAGLKNGVLAGSCPPRVLPTTSLGRSARTNAPHEGCTHAGPGRTRRFRAHSQHRTQSVFMHGSVAKQPY